MPSSAAILVLDVGKTLSKLSRWSANGVLLDKVIRPNARYEVDGLVRLDAGGIGAWVRETLQNYASKGPVRAIIPVGHGAGVAAIRNSELAFAPLDYEQPIPEAVMTDYRLKRDTFGDTGSPALPLGLNIGSQLHWIETVTPGALDGVALVPWAQYWSWFLSGVATSEVTSLGCHSDLWNPAAGDFSDLARSRGWANRFAPMAKAGDVVGKLKPEFGFGDTVDVHCGIHDSNAALLAARGFVEIEQEEVTVFSTGTWFIGMRCPKVPFDLRNLAEARDCLVNVDAHGAAVPSARFMGGREIEEVICIDTRRVDIVPDQPALLAAVAAVLKAGSMLLPTLVPDCGPFPNGCGHWVAEPADWVQRRAAACLYAALVANVSLDLIGAENILLVEGRFSEAEVFVRALASLRRGTRVYTSNAHNDVSLGALRLIDPSIRPSGKLKRVEPLTEDLTNYAAQWIRLAV
ncbi:MAG: carbohydrate kinase [Sphingomonadales bacterium]|nr:carbohydrate kinase [Sphingomonadales bacterium]